jgi:hypothetical protein
MANLYLSQGSEDGLRSVGARTGELGQWWRRGARSPPAKGGDWPENGGKVLSEMGELGRRRKMENGKWKRWHRKLALLLEIGRKIWGENGGDTAAGERDFREGENVEGENVGGKTHLALCFLADPKFGGK